jgi:hypothetical protein
MAKVVLSMQYEIQDEKRNDYLGTIQQLKTHFASNPFVQYSVYEQKGKKNSFVEMFVAETEEAFKQFEESDDEVADALANTLSDYFKDGKAKYLTCIEV